MMIVLFVLFKFKAFLFVQIFSIATFSFWLFALIQSLYTFTNDKISAIKTMIHLIAISAIFIGFGLLLRNSLRLNDVATHCLTSSELIYELLKAAIIGTLSLLMAILVYRIINKEGFNRQFEMIKSRIN